MKICSNVFLVIQAKEPKSNKQTIHFIAEKINLNRSRQSSDANILSKCQKPIPKAARL